MIRRIVLAAALALAAAPLSAMTYTIEPDYARVVFRWSHLGFSNPAAQLSQGQGTLEFDPANPSDPVCAGCQDAACIVLNHVEVDVPVAQQPPDGKNNYFSPEIANWVTWNGGGVSGGGCPGATPTRTATWGRVKSLYR